MPRKSRTTVTKDIFDEVSGGSVNGSEDIFDRITSTSGHFIDLSTNKPINDSSQYGGTFVDLQADNLPTLSDKPVDRSREVMGVFPPTAKIFKNPEERKQAAGELAGTAIDAAMGVSDAVTLGLSKPLTNEARKQMPDVGLTPNPVAMEAGKFAGFVIPFAAAHKVISLGAEALTGLSGALETAGSAGRIATAVTTGAAVGTAMQPEEGQTRASNALELAAIGAGFQSAAEFIPYIEAAVKESNWWRNMTVKERGLVLRTPEAMKEAGFSREEIDSIKVPLAQQARNNPEVFRKLQEERMQTEQPTAESNENGNLPSAEKPVTAMVAPAAGKGTGDVFDMVSPAGISDRLSAVGTGQTVEPGQSALIQQEHSSGQPVRTADVQESYPTPTADIFDSIIPRGNTLQDGGSVGTTLQSTIIPGAKEFAEQDVIPAMKSAGNIIKDSADQFRKIFTPTARTEDSMRTALNLRELGSRKARKLDTISNAIDTGRKYFDTHGGEITDQNSRAYQFITNVERGTIKNLPEIEQSMAELNADIFNGLLKEVRQRGKLQSVRTSEELKADPEAEFQAFYFPRLWKDPTKAASVMGEIMSKRPFEGTRAFSKRRTIAMFEDGIAAGLEPAYKNPMDMVYHKAAEIQKWLMAQDWIAGEKAAGRIKFVSVGQKPAEGWKQLDDRFATVYGPPQVQIKEAFDHHLYKSLDEFAKSIGVSHDRLAVLKGDGIGASTWGYAERTGKVATKFAGPESVLAHEIGHQLGFRYGLIERMNATPTLKKELRALSDLRWEGMNPPQSFKRYVRKGTEKEAVLLEAYIHAPERFKETAPTVFAEFEKFLNEKTELQQLKEIRRSLVLGSNSTQMPLPGPVLLGHYYAPEASATVLNNLVSTGLRGSSAFRAYLGAANVMNQFQLGFSAFHAGFTSLDAMISSFSLGLRQLSHGELKHALKSITETPIAAVSNIRRGAKMIREWGAPGSTDSDTAKLIEAAQTGGARARMDTFYHNEMVKAMLQAFRSGNYIGAALRLPFAATEQAIKPVLEWLVPRQKMGLIAQAAKYELERNPNMTHEELQKVMAQIVDSVDNRMGQLIYDNLFWNKIAKDLAMASVRSVGWNLGTIREVIGGRIDFAKEGAKVFQSKRPEMTYRMSYVIGLPVLVGILGATYQYLATGEGPKELKDYYFPQTGNFDAHGRPERISMPSYMKDLYHYSSDPVQTVKNKLHPMLSTVAEMLNNKDFYGVEIRHEDDPAMMQLLQLGKHAGKSLEPFASRGLRRNLELGETGVKAALPFVGITPAPANINKTKAEILADEFRSERMPKGSRTQEEYDRSKRAAKLTRELRLHNPDAAGMIADAFQKGEITRSQVKDLIRNSTLAPLQISFAPLSYDEATKVMEVATDDEKKLLLPMYLRKKGNYLRNDPTKTMQHESGKDI